MDAPFPPGCRAHFRPVARLAAGGFGEVWEATQEGLERRVAVKLLSAHVLTRAADVQRFLAEARVTASLTHPSIVVVHDLGCEEGVPWIAYELLPGPSLRERLDREGALPVADVIVIAGQVAAALGAAHEAGVVHRDVKPGNVLAAAPDRVKLTDFGIAKWAGAEVKTATGIVLGTPVYLAPEAIRGEEVGPASDLYALGVMLHEMLAGEPPFWSESVIDLMRMHLDRPPPDLRAARADVPAPLADLVRRLLAKTVADRLGPAAAVRAALEALRGAPGRLDTTRPVRADTRVQSHRTKVIAPPPARARRAALAGALSVLLVALALVVMVARQDRPSPTMANASAPASPPSVLEEPGEELEAEARRVDAEVFKPRDEDAAREKALDMCLRLARRRAPRPAPLPESLAARALERLEARRGEIRTAFLDPAGFTDPIQRASETFPPFIDDLGQMGWLLMARASKIAHQAFLQQIARKIADNRTIHEVHDQKGLVDAMLARWSKDHPDAWIVPAVRAARARMLGRTVLAELDDRREALARFEREHFAPGVVEPDVYEPWMRLMKYLNTLYGEFSTPRCQMELIARYARRMRTTRWTATIQFEKHRINFEAELARLTYGELAGSAYLKNPELPLPGWTSESHFVEAALREKASEQELRRRALRWCVVMARTAERPPVELARPVVDRAVDALCDYFDQIRKTPIVELAARPDKLRASFPDVIEELEAFWPVLLDRRAPATQQAALATRFTSVFEDDRLALVDPHGRASAAVERWSLRWPEHWVTALFAVPAIRARGDRAEMVRARTLVLERFEKEHGTGVTAASPWGLREWGMLLRHCVHDLCRDGRLAEARTAMAHFDTEIARFGAVVKAEPRLARALTAIRGDMHEHVDKASLPSPSPPSILGASDDPTSRRDRPGRQAVR